MLRVMGLSLVFLLGCTQKPSSDIPERREFKLNTAFSPCQDFYAYACSNVIKSFKLREDRSRHNFAFGDSHERLLKRRQDYFKKLSQIKASHPYEKRMQDFYIGCMDVEANKQGEKSFHKKYVDQVLALKTKDEFFELLSDKMLHPTYSWIDFGLIANQDDSNWMDLYLGVGLLVLPERSYYHKQDLMQDYVKLVEDYYKTIKMERSEERAKWYVDFEKQLAEVYPLPKEWREIVSSRRYTTREKLIQRYPRFRLDKFFKHIPKRTKIRDFIPESMDLLHRAMGEYSLERLKSMYLYNLRGYLEDSEPEYYEKRIAFSHKHLGGPPQQPPREERCTNLVRSYFSKELDFILLEKWFPHFPTQKVINLSERVRQSLVKSIEKNTWLSSSGKREALNKIKNASLQLVAPQTPEEWNFNLPSQSNPKTPQLNYFRWIEKNFEKKLLDLKNPVSKKRWGMSPLTVNAYYSPSYNKFVLPIGILQYPFFDPKVSDEANLGAMGAVIGHELGHAVDDKGSLYDSKGRLRTWMTKEDLEKFRERGESLIGQFNSIGRNGELTLGENIGDLVGLTAAYETAFVHGPKKLSLESKREFFLQWARTWCEVFRPKYRERKLKTDPHAMGRARVNEQVKHQVGFAEAYQCKTGDPMFLKKEDRVHIW